MTSSAPPSPPAHDRCAFLLSHALDDVTLARWREWRAGMAATHDVVLALTSQQRAAAAALGLREVLFVDPGEIFLPAYRPKGATGKVVPGNVDLVILALRRLLPGYRYYLSCEFDVFLPRGCNALVAADAATDAALVVSQFRSAAVDPTWMHWRTMAPAPRDAGVAAHAGLFPLSRYSAALLDALDSAYRDGWKGHYEATVPSIAVARGLSVETWNDAAARAGLPPLTDEACFHWQKMRPVAPHLAHHPVKTAAAARGVAAALGLPPPQEVPPW